MNKSNLLHRIFRAGIFIKGINGFLQLIGGIILFFISLESITKIVQKLFGYELIQDPNDFIANYLMAVSQELSLSTKLYGAIFLFTHGIINIVIVAELWRNRVWAFPIAGIVLGIFVIYQIYRIVHTHSILLSIFTVLDLLIILLLKFEYSRQKKLERKHRKR